MSLQLHELKPPLVKIVLDQKVFMLKPFTLNEEVEVIHKFGSMKNTMGFLNSPTEKNPYTVFILAWQLLEDKEYFGTLDKFIKSCKGNSKRAFIRAGQSCFKGVKQSIEDSGPLIKNPERMAFLHKQAVMQGKEKEQVCYASYFEKISSRFGYTINEFYELTMRQLHALLKCISNSKYEELEVQAVLAGRKMKPRIEYDDITPEQEKENEKAGENAHAELQRRFKERNEGK